MTIRLSALTVLLFALSTLTLAQQVNLDWDRAANFANYHTYAWETSPNPAKGDWNQRIIDQVDKQLQAKGLTKVDANPDLWVVYTNSMKNVHQVVGVGYGLGSNWGWGSEGGPASHVTFAYKEGTLVVELADTGNKQLVWRGEVSDTITDNTNKNIKNLDKSVAKLFKEYPPKQKK